MEGDLCLLNDCSARRDERREEAMKRFVALAFACMIALTMAGCGPSVDKTELKEAIEQAEALDLSPYTEESVVTFDNALKSAKSIYEGNSADEEMVSEYAQGLRDAIEGLHAHELSEWAIVQEATCSSPGARQATCSTCGETVTESIAALPHTDGEWEVTKNFSVNPSGTVTPGERSLKCAVCGQVIRSEPYTVELTVSQQNAMKTAGSYLSFTAFSHDGLVDQLEFEGYPTEDAIFAADNCGADWNEQAAQKAADYLDFMGFSRAGLIEQLQFEGFTYEQAVYGVDSVGL